MKDTPLPRVMVTLRMTGEDRSTLQQLAFDNDVSMQELCMMRLFPERYNPESKEYVHRIQRDHNE